MIELKQKNRSDIFRLLYECPDLTRQDLVSRLNLSLPTVTANLNRLIGENLVIRSGSIGNTGGRRAQTYRVDARSKVSIGIDLSKNHITGIMLDLEGTILCRKRTCFPFARSDDYARKIGELVEDILAESGISEKKLLGVALGMHGCLSPDRRVVTYGELLNCTGATTEEFSKYIPYRTEMFRDSFSACLSEYWRNAALSIMYYLYVGENVGGGLFIDGEPFYGITGNGGSTGHMISVPNGQKCYCGNRGCAETYCSTTNLASFADNDLQKFFDLFKQGNQEASDLWEDYLQHLTIFIHNLQMCYDAYIVIGGDLGQYADFYLDELRRRLNAMNPFHDNADLVIQSKRQDPVAYGSALNFIDEFVSSV